MKKLLLAKTKDLMVDSIRNYMHQNQIMFPELMWESIIMVAMQSEHCIESVCFHAADITFKHVTVGGWLEIESDCYKFEIDVSEF